MIIKKIKTFCLINKIKEHKENKDQLLNLIKKIPTTNLIENNDSKIKHSDWSLDKNFKREYLEHFYKMIEPYMIDIMKVLKCKSWQISNGWFQQYSKSDFHSWHVHPNANFTNVYYLELPDKKEKTQIYNALDNKIENFNISEGDLITFPAYLIHRSKPLNVKTKTIISFNSNFFDARQDIII